MKNEVTEKLELFLKNLRCEDAERETLVHLDSCREETERLAGLEEEYTQVMDGLDQRSRAILENYIEQMLSKAFAEQQESYLQGLLDAFQKEPRQWRVKQTACNRRIGLINSAGIDM